MYKITFEVQPRQGYPDYESGSICLSHEQYLNLPEIPSVAIFDKHCVFSRTLFSEQVRYPHKTFEAVLVSNKNWKLKPFKNNHYEFLNDDFYWVLVCLNMEKDVWIAFKYYDAVPVSEAYCATVSVAHPSHEELYRLDSHCAEIVRQFYPKQ